MATSAPVPSTATRIAGDDHRRGPARAIAVGGSRGEEIGERHRLIDAGQLDESVVGEEPGEQRAVAGATEAQAQAQAQRAADRRLVAKRARHLSAGEPAEQPRAGRMVGQLAEAHHRADDE